MVWSSRDMIDLNRTAADPEQQAFTSPIANHFVSSSSPSSARANLSSQSSRHHPIHPYQQHVVRAHHAAVGPVIPHPNMSRTEAPPPPPPPPSVIRDAVPHASYRHHPYQLVRLSGPPPPPHPTTSTIPITLLQQATIPCIHPPPPPQHAFPENHYPFANSSSSSSSSTRPCCCCCRQQPHHHQLPRAAAAAAAPPPPPPPPPPSQPEMTSSTTETAAAPPVEAPSNPTVATVIAFGNRQEDGRCIFEFEARLTKIFVTEEEYLSLECQFEMVPAQRLAPVLQMIESITMSTQTPEQQQQQPIPVSLPAAPTSSGWQFHPGASSSSSSGHQDLRVSRAEEDIHVDLTL